MKLTYANVMSTIAMFAAVTTGGSYAATQLGANTVGSTQVKNGSIQAVDLAPSIRKQMGTAAAKPTAKPAAGWTNTKLSYNAVNWKCLAASCNQAQESNNSSGMLKMNLTGKYTRFNISGSITPQAMSEATSDYTATAPSAIAFYVEGAPSYGATPHTLATCIAYDTSQGDAAGVLDQSYTVKCTDNNMVMTNSDNQFMRIRMSVSMPAGSNEDAQTLGNITVQSQPVNS